MAPQTAPASAIQTPECRRKALRDALVHQVAISKGLDARGYGFGMHMAAVSFRRDDEGYVRQELASSIRASLGYADRPDIAVEVTVRVISGLCPCAGACRCAVHRKIYVRVYDKQLPANAHIGANINLPLPA